jgi:hypothetical protein
MRSFLVICVIFGFSTSLLWGQGALQPTQSQGSGALQQTQPSAGGDFSANTNPQTKVPKDVIIVKGAWASSSDSSVPEPEDGSAVNNVYVNKYFGLTYPLPADWTEKYKGPPPSDFGLYVLAQLVPRDTANGLAETSKGKTRGTIQISAQDMFFTPMPANNARQLVNFRKNHLQDDYKLELKPTETKIAGQPFIFFSYWSPVAELHWYVLATQIRCHAVEIVLTSRDTKLLESLMLDMNKMKLPAEASPTGGTGGGDVPTCVKNYASGDNIVERVDPVLTDRRFNAIPVRIIIDKQGKVKHIHFLSAFPEQAKAIGDALKQWKFRPYLRDGVPAEVETGIMFGRAPQVALPGADAATD